MMKNEIRTEVVAALLRGGASARARDKNGRVPLHRAAYHGLKAIGELLLAHGANVHDADDDGRTPKDIATLGQEAEMAAWLETVAAGHAAAGKSEL